VWGFFKFLAYSLIVILLLLLALLFATIESQPLVLVESNKQVEQADSVNQLLAQTHYSLVNRYNYQDIPLSLQQLNSLVGVIQRALPAFNGKFSLNDRVGLLQASYRLPIKSIPFYLNLQFSLLPGNELNIGEVKVGSLIIPGHIALPAALKLADWWTNSDIASQFVQQIDKITLLESSMVVRLKPLDTFLKLLNQVKNGVGIEQDEGLRIRTAHYLKLLSELPINSRLSNNSLALYMGPLFTDVRFRSTPETAVDENEAAIMALAIYAGHHRFANFIGEVQPKPGKAALPIKRPVLAGRTDLTQHFLFSAAIKILSQQGISAAIGEFKELMDRGEGGSGYSFVDLAADTAGIRFAQTALTAENAIYLQTMLAGNIEENVFFPDISQLPEGLTKEQFLANFTEVDSPLYNQMRELINARVDNLSAYRSFSIER
jgi:hypothetical protein